MQFTMHYEPSKDICFVEVSGSVQRPKDSFGLQKVARTANMKYGYSRFLFDMSMATITGSTIDTYTVGTMPVDTDGSQRKHKVALVYSKRNSFDSKFLENVVVNRGYNIKVFCCRDCALKWLQV